MRKYGELHSLVTGSRFPNFYLGTIGGNVPTSDGTLAIEAIRKLDALPGKKR